MKNLHSYYLIANGDYDDDPARMIQDIETGQYPYDMITTALVYGQARMAEY